MNKIDSYITAYMGEKAFSEENRLTLFALLDAYYYGIETDVGNDSDNDTLTFPNELSQNIDERESGIGNRLKNIEIDVNSSDGCFNTLMLAVGHADAPMVKFLLEHGADPNVWIGMDEEPNIPKQNWYLEDIDIQYMNESFGNEKCADYLDALIRTATVLTRYGRLNSFGGICLTVDKDGNGCFSGRKTLF